MVTEGSLPPETIFPDPFGQLVLEPEIIFQGDTDQLRIIQAATDRAQGGVMPAFDIMNAVIFLFKDVAGGGGEEVLLDLPAHLWGQPCPNQVVALH